MNMSFDYKFASVADLVVETDTDSKSGKRVASTVLLNDEPLQPTERFWTSLYARYGFNKSFFKYFDYPEVFQRISNVESQDRMRLCIERDHESGVNRLLAVSNPTKPIVRHDDLMQTLEQHDSLGLSYCGGIVESTHAPRVGGNSFQISGDNFSNRFIMSTPIDGYGLPSIYLALLREICSNGIVGYAKTFRSSLALGRGDDDVIYSIVRALDGFGNDEGYAALRQRFEAATQSWASVYEAMSLYKLLIRLLHRSHVPSSVTNAVSNLEILAGFEAETTLELPDSSSSPIVTAFHKMTGDISQQYGLANIDALSVKRQRTLPVRCTTYDLLNFLSELATHHADELGARESQAWLGTLVSNEYDLESSRDTFDEFQDFFLNRKLDGETSMELQKLAI